MKVLYFCIWKIYYSYGKNSINFNMQVHKHVNVKFHSSHEFYNNKGEVGLKMSSNDEQ